MAHSGNNVDPLANFKINSSFDERNFGDFIIKRIGPSTLAAAKQAVSDIANTILYFGRLNSKRDRCSVIEEVMEILAVYNRTGTAQRETIDEAYKMLLYAIYFGNKDKDNEIEFYAGYAARIAERNGLVQVLAMFIAPLRPDQDKIKLISTSPEIPEQDKPLHNSLAAFVSTLAPFSKAFSDCIAAAEQSDVREQKTCCDKVIRYAFVSFYLAFTLVGSGSGAKGGLSVPSTLYPQLGAPTADHCLTDGVPDVITSLCGLLGYLCWVCLFMLHRDSVEHLKWKGENRRETAVMISKNSATILFSAFTSLPSALFASVNMAYLVNCFMSNGPAVVQTMLPSAAQLGSFSINLILNISIVAMILNLPNVIRNYTKGVHGLLPRALTALFLGTAFGVGLAGTIPYFSKGNPLPAFLGINPSPNVNMALSIGGDLPSGMLGSLCLLSGASPLGIFTAPQYRPLERILGVILGLTATLVYYKYIDDMFTGHDAVLNPLNHPIIRWIAQILAAIGNFMTYAPLPAALVKKYGPTKAIPPLIPLLIPNGQHHPSTPNVNEDEDALLLV